MNYDGSYSGSTGATNRVLVVDDMADIRLVAAAALEHQGFHVAQVEDGEQAVSLLDAGEPFDLVVLDINLPGMSGLEVLRRLRTNSALPVILLSGRDEETDRVLGLELGADDYVVKPFSTRELAARARSVLRRVAPRETSGGLVFGPLVVHLAERRILRDGEPVEVTAKEFDLFAFFATAPPRRVFSRAELLERVWGSSAEWQDPATVTEHVRRLRKKVERDPEQPQLLQTVRGVGYRFDPAPGGSFVAGGRVAGVARTGMRTP